MIHLQHTLDGDEVVIKQQRPKRKRKNIDYSTKERVGDFLLLGGGVQSTTLFYMMIEGVLPRPLAVIFSDTGDESLETYEHIIMLERLATKANIDFIRCGAGSISGEMRMWREGRPYKDSGVMGTMPVWVDTGKDRPGRLRRQCSDYAKILPTQNVMKGWMYINGKATLQKGASPYAFLPMAFKYFDKRLKYTRQEYWDAKHNSSPRVIVNDKYVRVAFGITTDESYRIGDRGLVWQQAWYPLFDMGMTRDDCIQWMQDRGYPPVPKSACVQCPYRSNPSWLAMYETHTYLLAQAKRLAVLDKRDPDDVDSEYFKSDWNKACKVDEMLRDQRFLMNNPFYGQIRGTMYLHESCIPLRELGDSGQLKELATSKPSDTFQMEMKVEALETCGSRGNFSCFS